MLSYNTISKVDNLFLIKAIITDILSDFKIKCAHMKSCSPTFMYPAIWLLHMDKLQCRCNKLCSSPSGKWPESKYFLLKYVMFWGVWIFLVKSLPWSVRLQHVKNVRNYLPAAARCRFCTELYCLKGIPGVWGLLGEMPDCTAMYPSLWPLLMPHMYAGPLESDKKESRITCYLLQIDFRSQRLVWTSIT